MVDDFPQLTASSDGVSKWYYLSKGRKKELLPLVGLVCPEVSLFFMQCSPGGSWAVSCTVTFTDGSF